MADGSQVAYDPWEMYYVYSNDPDKCIGGFALSQVPRYIVKLAYSVKALHAL